MASEQPSPTLRVRGLIHLDGHILMARLTARPVAFLPGGRVEPGESLPNALHREFQEETGVTITDMSYLGCIEHIWAAGTQRTHDLTHFFTVASTGFRIDHVPTCNDEGVVLFWMPVAEMEQTPLMPEIQKPFIRNTLKGDTMPWWAFIDEIA